MDLKIRKVIVATKDHRHRTLQNCKIFPLMNFLFIGLRNFHFVYSGLLALASLNLT